MISRNTEKFSASGLNPSGFRKLIITVLLACMNLSVLTDVHGEESQPEPEAETAAETEAGTEAENVEEPGSETETETEEETEPEPSEPDPLPEGSDETDTETEEQPVEEPGPVTEDPAVEIDTVSGNGKWVRDSHGWWYRRSDGTYPADEWLKLNGLYYHFDSRGYMQTGWLSLNGIWYYLQNSGAMASSVWVGNYYLKSDGRMAVSEWVDNGKYYVGSDGRWVKAKWVRNSHGWWYRNPDGTYPADQWLELNGLHYHFDSDGYMQTGWIQTDGSWYYLRNSGAMASSVWIGNYYLKSDGRMAVSEWVDNGKYYVGSDGKWIRYYGITGWQKTKDGWWYSRGDGTYPVSEWEYINNHYYYFNSSGYMKTGWLRLGFKWYYLSNSGAMYTGWLLYNKQWYYLKDNGEMACNEVIDDYYIDENGVWQKEYSRRLTLAEGVSSDNIFMKGIDISSWQGNIDLSYYQDGFVIIRVSWGTHEDKLAQRNMDLCEELGIPYGVYVYSYALSDAIAVEEADFLLDIIEGRNIQCGVWFDMEDSDGYKARNDIEPDDPLISSMCKAFCDRITEAGYHAGIYASYNWFENYITDCDQYDKWVAHWGVNNGELNRNLSDMGVIHQYTSEPLDKNVMYVDISHFSNGNE